GVGLATALDPAWPHRALGWPYWLAVAAVAAFLARQVRALRRYRDARALEAFNVNLALGPLVLLGTVLGLGWRWRGARWVGPAVRGRAPTSEASLKARVLGAPAARTRAWYRGDMARYPDQSRDRAGGEE